MVRLLPSARPGDRLARFLGRRGGRHGRADGALLDPLLGFGVEHEPVHVDARAGAPRRVDRAGLDDLLDLDDRDLAAIAAAG
jgi:hypothetical protein